MSKPHYLIVMAMREEGQGLLEKEGLHVVYTGLGKVNASYHLLKELARLEAQGVRPDAVLNFGTAGSSRFLTHELVECTGFVQRDMDLSPLGFAPGHTPYDHESEASAIAAPKRLSQLLSGVCGTGDSFETGRPKVECDLVDMEAFALAKICRRENLAFLSVKYISDGADHNAHNDWAQNLNRAASRFVEVYQTIADLPTL